MYMEETARESWYIENRISTDDDEAMKPCPSVHNNDNVNNNQNKLIDTEAEVDQYISDVEQATREESYAEEVDHNDNVNNDNNKIGNVN